MRRGRTALILCGLCSLAWTGAAFEPVTINVGKIKDFNVRLYGAVAMDVIADTTQSFTEEECSNLVQPRLTSLGASNYAGQHGRTEFSIRDSRLGLELNVPKTEGGLTAQGLFEMDLLGNNAPNTLPGTTPGTQTERDFYNSPAMRLRLAYLNLTHGGWNAKVGQYWSLLGWQPAYFPAEPMVQPTPGQLYRRFAQARVMYTWELPGSLTLESAADASRPAQINSGIPEFHAGVRLASTKIKGATTNFFGTSMVGLSAALTGALIPVRTAIGNPTGGALAFDFLVPLIPSSDGQDRSNNLVWLGEASAGSGVGGLEYAALTSGIPAVAASNTAKTGYPTIPGAGSAVDSGVAGVNNDGHVELIRFRAFRTHLQYFLPGGKWAVSTGYSQVEGRNLDRFTTYANAAARQAADNLAAYAFIAPKMQYGYVSAYFDPLSWLRFSAEFSKTRDTYNDSACRFAVNDRFQFTTYFIF